MRFPRTSTTGDNNLEPTPGFGGTVQRKTSGCSALSSACSPPLRYLTAEQIRQAVPGYPEQDELFKRMFERDKEGPCRPGSRAQLRDTPRGGLAGRRTVTTGQSFGGDLETGDRAHRVLAARHVLGADIAVIAQGPGNLGIRDAVGFLRGGRGRRGQRGAALGGARWRRCGSATRTRGCGTAASSHHSLTAYGRVAAGSGPTWCAPAGRGVSAPGWRPSRPAGRPARAGHQCRRRPRGGAAGVPARLSTMAAPGRGLAYFLAASGGRPAPGRLLREVPSPA